MKIVHIITRMIVGGAQENTLFTCRDLLELGDDVRLLTGPSLGPEGELQRQSAGADAAPIEVPTIEVPALRRAIHPWRDWRAYRDLRRLLRELRPDVVHTHSAKGGILGRQAAWSLGVPAVVHTVHGAPFHPYQGRATRAFYRACERRAAGHCHRLISVADAMTDLMVEGGVAPREKFVTIYSGMDVEPLLQAERHRAATRRRLGFADDMVVVGKIARLFHLKGHEYVLEAARRIASRVPQVHFLLVGDGVFRDRLEREAAAAGLGDRFHFTGLVPPAEIPSLLAAMDMLVHASLREGLARALPQALIAGRPAISFDVDGAREVVVDGETGVLLAPRDVPGLAEAIVRLAESAELRQRLGLEGRRRFTDRFRHQTMTRQIRDVYRDILGPDRSG